MKQTDFWKTHPVFHRNLNFGGMSCEADFWKTRPYLKTSLAPDLILYENWGTHEIRMDKFSRNRFSSWPENWNFGKIFEWVFHDLPIRVKNFNLQTQRGKWIQQMGNKTFELLHSNGDLFRSFDFVSCDSSNSVLFSILFPFYDYSSEGT